MAFRIQRTTALSATTVSVMFCNLILVGRWRRFAGTCCRRVQDI